MPRVPASWIRFDEGIEAIGVRVPTIRRRAAGTASARARKLATFAEMEAESRAD
jgi:hypothetical protein